MNDPITHAIAFLVGTATGAAGTYFAEKYTDRRREKEAARQEATRFYEMVGMMPDLLTEMKKDLASPGCETFREFFVVGEHVSVWASKDSFIYRISETNQYLSKVRILESHGYVIDITPKNAPMFRMQETLVRLLKSWENA